MANVSAKTQSRAAQRVFSIGPDNRVALADRRGGKAGETFTTEEQFRTFTAEWPGSRFVKVWNNLPGAAAIKKFTNRETAVRRIWKAVQESQPAQASTASKTEMVIALLRRPLGATLAELMAATGWQAHSVRGFLSAQLTKRKRLRVKSSKRDGERVYRIRS